MFYCLMFSLYIIYRAKYKVEVLKSFEMIFVSLNLSNLWQFIYKQNNFITIYFIELSTYFYRFLVY